MRAVRLDGKPVIENRVDGNLGGIQPSEPRPHAAAVVINEYYIRAAARLALVESGLAQGKTLLADSRGIVGGLDWLLTILERDQVQAGRTSGRLARGALHGKVAPFSRLSQTNPWHAQEKGNGEYGSKGGLSSPAEWIFAFRHGQLLLEKTQIAMFKKYRIRPRNTFEIWFTCSQIEIAAWEKHTDFRY